MLTLTEMEENRRIMKEINDKTSEGISIMDNFKNCFGYVEHTGKIKVVLSPITEAPLRPEAFSRTAHRTTYS